MSSIKVTEASFEAEVISAPGPVLVDFWAEWCGPCRAIGPALEEISDELSGKVTVAKLNIDDHPEVAAKFEVRAIPTMILFRDGQPVATKLGAHPKSQLKTWVEQNI